MSNHENRLCRKIHNRCPRNKRRDHCDPRFTKRYTRKYGTGWYTLLKPQPSQSDIIAEQLEELFVRDDVLWERDLEEESAWEQLLLDEIDAYHGRQSVNLDRLGNPRVVGGW